jgi:Bifunctional DNA primase/polymerase, N-terminal
LTSDKLSAALAYASSGWPVFWCKPGSKQPATSRGFKDATTDPERITRLWTACPDLNIAVPTGEPGPDVLDIDVRDGGSGYEALGQLKRAGLLAGARALIRTPSGGLHIHFVGTDQQCGRLPRQYLDFKSRGGYVLVPPSVVGGKPYELLDRRQGADSRLDWATVHLLLDPPVRQYRALREDDREHSVTRLIEWVARQDRPGHRHDPLKWAAFRLLEEGQLDDTVAAELVDASVRAGHDERDAWSCVRSIQRKAVAR